EGWDVLTRHLRGRGFTEQELLTGGLASNGRRGLIDKFRGRLIWPIADLTGDVIAFGARKLRADDDGPKYLNTPETPLFKKSSVLYGADLARREISQRRQAVLVEGYTDVMACHLAGIGTAVATSGTSFGEGHVGILRRLLMDSDKFLGEVIFTFDGDAAGDKAAKIVGRIKDQGLRGRYAISLDRWLGMMDERFVLERVRLHSGQGPAASNGRPHGRGQRGGGPAGGAWATGRPAGATAAGVPQPRDSDAPPYDMRDPVTQIEREALKLAVQRPALCGPTFDALGAGCFTAASVHSAAFAVIAACGGASTAAGGGREWAEQLRNAAPDDGVRAFITQLAVEPARA